MKQVRMVALIAAAFVSETIAQEIMIDSIDCNGLISFSGVQLGSTARVEWAASLVDVGRTNWHSLTNITVTNSSMTADIPMFFRVRGTPQQNLFMNGGFELPVIPTNSVANILPDGWEANSSFYLLFNGDGGHPTPAWWPQPREGNQYMNIGNRADFWLSQTVTVSQAGAYTLTWYDNTAVADATPLQSMYSVSFARVSGSTIASITNDAWHAGIWTQKRLDLVLPDGAYVLTFTPEGTVGSFDTLLDDVRLLLNW